MIWNWQCDDWPRFRWDNGALDEAENEFLRRSGLMTGLARHLSENDRNSWVVELITGEAIDTAEIEGEYLDRDSVQSSVLRNFGLLTDHRRVQPAESGMADMMSDLYRHHDQPLSHDKLFQWHAMLTRGRQDLIDVGRYRTHEEPMRVVSGRADRPTIHFQAPPSNRMPKEMAGFMDWWQGTAPGSGVRLGALTRSALAHLYFVCIHPFEDGNGRIARALAAKSLAEHLGSPTLIAVSYTINRNRKAYYQALERNNKGTEITDWLVYFAQTILEAQAHSSAMLDFIIEKTKLYDRVRGALNPRQAKVLERMFREGLDGFEGGLSRDNYLSITQTSPATATRDLDDLVQKGAMFKTGELKSTRYHLNIQQPDRTPAG